MIEKNLSSNLKVVFLFCCSGTLGFCVDTSFYYFFSIFFSFYTARLFSFILAVIFTWLFNRTLTFRGTGLSGSKMKEFSLYLLSMCVGGTANYATFVVLMKTYSFIHNLPILGIGVGSIVGLTINFTLSKLVVFRK